MFLIIIYAVIVLLGLFGLFTSASLYKEFDSSRCRNMMISNTIVVVIASSLLFEKIFV